MDGLLDIGPLTETITVRGKDITIYGISAEGLFYLISTFPEVRNLMSDTQTPGAGITIDPQAIMKLAGKVIGTVIACGLVDRNKFEEYEDWKKQVEENALVAMKLAAPVQLKFVNTIFRLTFEDVGGVGPFVEQLNELTRVMTEATDSGLPGAQVGKSPRPSRSVMTMDTTPNGRMRGYTRPADFGPPVH